MTRSHANLGRAWEGRLIAWHHGYKQAGHAYIAQAHPPVKVLSKPVRGRFSACWAKDGPPDFVGVALGRAVVFDAKHCEGERWPLEQLAPHQARDLEAATKAGAVAFVALEIDGTGWVLPWSTLGPRWIRWGKGQASRGEASLTIDDCADLGLPMDPADGWLPAVRLLLQRRAP